MTVCAVLFSRYRGESRNNTTLEIVHDSYEFIFHQRKIQKVALKILPSPELKCKWVFIIKLHFPVKSTTHKPVRTLLGTEYQNCSRLTFFAFGSAKVSRKCLLPNK